MSPPKGGYGGIEIPSDIPPSSDPGEQLLRDAARALRAAERRFDEAQQRNASLEHTVNALTTEVGVLRGTVTGLDAKLTKQSEDISTILLLQSAAKSAWNKFGGQIIAYGVALLAGGWGIGKITTESKQPAPQVIQQPPSPFDKLVDECRKLSDYPPSNVTGMSPRVDCLVRISKEQFTPR